MNWKKLVTITVAAAILLIAALFLGVQLNQEYEKRVDVRQQEEQGETKKTANATKEQMPLLDQGTGKVLFPLRFIMDELGGILQHQDSDNATTIKFQNKLLRLESGKENATLNGYGIVLKESPKIINGAMYVSPDILSQYFGVTVDWKEGNNEMSLRTTGGKVPVIATNVLHHKQQLVSYQVEIPIVIGLNDNKYEKNLNYMISTEMVKQVQEFVSVAKSGGNTAENPGILISNVTVSSCSAQWISLSIEGKMVLGDKEKYLKRSINLDLTKQKLVLLASMFKKDNYERKLSRWMGDDGWAEEAQNQYYIQGSPDGKEKQLVIYLWKEDEKKFGEMAIPLKDLKKSLNLEYQEL